VIIAVLVVLALLAVLPFPFAHRYRLAQLACFDSLVSNRAPLAAFDHRFGASLYQHTYASGATLYAYEISSEITAFVALKNGQVQDHGKSTPDYFTFAGDVVARYADSSSLLRHPHRIGTADCR
jgi:hypothetical protein